MQFLGDSKVKSAFAKLKSMRYDLQLLVNPKEALKKYNDALKTISTGLADGKLKAIVEWLSVESNTKQLPDEYKTSMEKDFQMPLHDLFSMILANWDTISGAF